MQFYTLEDICVYGTSTINQLGGTGEKNQIWLGSLKCSSYSRSHDANLILFIEILVFIPGYSASLNIWTVEFQLS